MKLQNTYSISIIQLINDFSTAEKGLFRIKSGIACIQIKLCKELKIKIRIGKRSLGLVEIYLELKMVFGNNMGFLMTFRRKIKEKWVLFLKKSPDQKKAMWGCKKHKKNPAPLLA